MNANPRQSMRADGERTQCLTNIFVASFGAVNDIFYPASVLPFICFQKTLLCISITGYRKIYAERETFRRSFHYDEGDLQ